MLTVNQRIEMMRKLMNKRGIDIYYVPNEDDHLSQEYTAKFFQCKSFISGFSGESGCVIITKDFAGLWTDGRYFTQAEKELEGTCIELMRLRQPGIPDPIDYLVEHTPANGVLGFDGSVVSASDAKYIGEELKKKNAKVAVNEDLAGKVWGDYRPAMPSERLFILAKKYTGEDPGQRISRVREEMKKYNADILILTALEDPCWLLNIRGGDIESTPVAYAFALVTKTKVFYYVDECKLTAAVKKHFETYGVTVRRYQTLVMDLKTLKNKMIWANLRQLNACLYAQLDETNTILNLPSPVLAFRGTKNSVEIKSTINAHVKDGIAMVKFIYWLKQNVKKGKLNEISAQNKLYELREEGKDYLEPSFTTICAYQANGAMMHYNATLENYAEIKPKGFLLVDSGGTYKDGTTDITRTIAVGPLSDREKMLYTKVLKGHLDLARAKFLAGTTGNNLDILARGPLWDMNIDYQCGTGHGVGHVLGVHEGPHQIRWGLPTVQRPSAPLEPGMIVTDEPGVYLPGEIGIRIENELLVVESETNFYGKFMKFDMITYCPYESEAIDVNYLNEEEIAQLNAYHQMVYDTISPYLTEAEAGWLKKVCREVSK